MHTLQVKERAVGDARKLRRTGFVPGVVYGPSIESTPITIGRKDLQVLFSKITRSSLISLAIEGETSREFDVFLKVVDYDQITDEPRHVDFYHPDIESPLNLLVPVKTVGECAGIKSGGILNVQFNAIPVYGLARDVPALITIDVESLNMGDSIYVRDIDFGGVEPMLPPERTVVTVIAPRGLLAEGAAAAELAEGEEGEADAGASEEAVAEE
ncbi:MAG: 50S ribosomal protein L25 [Candidatus Atribacteria bacterium]|jgi:large subunit ribosomal protein L25|nr:MAG: 50S ribosomal protein L25 [Candidatus Atribacteria bacterium]